MKCSWRDGVGKLSWVQKQGNRRGDWRDSGNKAGLMRLTKSNFQYRKKSPNLNSVVQKYKTLDSNYNYDTLFISAWRLSSFKLVSCFLLAPGSPRVQWAEGPLPVLALYPPAWWGVGLLQACCWADYSAA